MKDKIGIVLIVLFFLFTGYVYIFLEDEEPISDFDLGYQAAQDDLLDWFDEDHWYYSEIWASGYDEGYSEGLRDGLSAFR